MRPYHKNLRFACTCQHAYYPKVVSLWTWDSTSDSIFGECHDDSEQLKELVADLGSTPVNKFGLHAFDAS